jgi:hypothetical protein
MCGEFRTLPALFFENHFQLEAWGFFVVLIDLGLCSTGRSRLLHF